MVVRLLIKGRLLQLLLPQEVRLCNKFRLRSVACTCPSSAPACLELGKLAHTN